VSNVLAWLAAVLGLVICLGVARICYWYGCVLTSLWREPVLRYPVLVIESDDWGAGPLIQADALQRLLDLLLRFRDHVGAYPKMALGVVLAVADTEAMRNGAEADFGYRRILLKEEVFVRVREVMQAGEAAGVFTLQLHGQEHYWPQALMEGAETSTKVRTWLTGAPFPVTEALPSHLQSRWVNCARLPSSTLPEKAIAQAVEEEALTFAQTFGEQARVAVPPTFIWSEGVEHQWQRAGIKVVITPGRRLEGRDVDGRPAGAGLPLRNGMRAQTGIVYLVRDAYFEPSRGHTVADGIRAIHRKSYLRRPVLLETHRFNFLQEESCDKAFAALEQLLGRALAEFPELRFVSSDALAHALVSCDPQWVDPRIWVRASIWLRRLCAECAMVRLPPRGVEILSASWRRGCRTDAGLGVPPR
jgi:hypothetical protein